MKFYPNTGKIVVCIPALNEEEHIATLVSGLRSRSNAQVIVVDDGSRDATSLMAVTAGAEVVRHDVSMGQWAALRTAFARALENDAEVIVTFDGDGQHSPADLDRVVEPVLSGKVDISIGSRYLADLYHGKRHRKLGTTFFNGMILIATGYRLTDCMSGLTAMNSRVVRDLLPLLAQPQYGRLEFLVLANKRGYSIGEVPARFGSSSKSTKGELGFAFNLFGTLVKSTLMSRNIVPISEKAPESSRDKDPTPDKI